MEDNKNNNDSNLPEEGVSGSVSKDNQEVNPEIGSVNDSNVEESSACDEEEEVSSKLAIEQEKVKQESKAVVESNIDTKGKVEKVDYSMLSRAELLKEINSLINSYPVELIKDAVEEVKVVFYKKLTAEKEEALKEFVEEGGVAEEYTYQHDGLEDTFKEVYNQYRDKKTTLAKKQTEEKQANLKIKHKIIEEISELINKEESINKTFQEFRDLQDKWRNVGLIPQNEMKSLWESYHHEVEKFYDYVNINKELRDLDLKKNLEDKINLCEKAEALLLEESVTKAFKMLQGYHEKWRETGPVPRDQKDDIWDRFKAVTVKINKKHQAFFDEMKGQQLKNLEQKEILCQKVEELIKASFSKPKDWEDKANELIEIQKLWRVIGFAPKKDNNKIYQRFKDACDAFFNKKREFYKEAKAFQKNNNQLKLDIIIQAEALKDSTDWKKTTDDIIALQKKWKEVGPVPRKQSEILWKRFREACDFFFNAKSEFFGTEVDKQDENLKHKLEIVEKVKNFKKKDDDKETLNQLMDIQKDWAEIGFVPIKEKEKVQKEFREAINAQFEKLDIEDGERETLNFKTKIDGWVSSQSKGKLYSERNKIINKIKELENEISLYENNIGFFSTSDKSNKMLDGIYKKIEQAKERMATYKQKLSVLDSADDE